MPLWLAVLILFITVVGGGGYLLIKIWFYFLNARMRRNCADMREKLTKEANLSEEIDRPVFVGFFHPYWYVLFLNSQLIYSNAGGGGERVLWTAIKTIQTQFPHVISIVYSGDVDVTPEAILESVHVLHH